MSGSETFPEKRLLVKVFTILSLTRGHEGERGVREVRERGERGERRLSVRLFTFFFWKV